MVNADGSENQSVTLERSGPVATAERITNLDLVRGIATLGILAMNAVSFGLDDAYFNLGNGNNSLADRVVGALGEIFIDQKMMAIFSLLFGAGVVIFADRAQAKGRRPVLLSLWRNLLLLAIGLAHGFFFDGDVLQVYAFCAPFVLLLRNRSPRTLLIVGGSLLASTVAFALAVAPTIDPAGADFGEIWVSEATSMTDAVGVWLLWEFFARSLGLMLIGVAFFRLGYLNATGPRQGDVRRMAWGVGVGLPLAVLGYGWNALSGFDPQAFLPSHAVNSAATVPLAIGYIGAISLWNRAPNSALHDRFRAVGRMALTNYLTQTMLGLVILGWLLSDVQIGRSGVLAVVVLIWLIQLAWSAPWLKRFSMGPLERLWRILTYRSL